MLSDFWKKIEQNDGDGLLSVLKAVDIDENSKDQFGLSPIHVALAKTSQNVINILI